MSRYYPNTACVTLFIRIIIFCIILSHCHSQSCVINGSLPQALYAHQTAYDILSHCVYIFVDSNIYKRNMNQLNWVTLAVSTPTSYFYSYAKNSIIINRIVYFVGIMGNDFQSGEVYKFDIDTEEWMPNNQLTSPPHPSIFGCLTGNQSHLFMVGGRTCDDTNEYCYDEYLQIYDIDDNSWTAEAINISPIQGNGWAEQYCHMTGNDLYVFGGYNGVTSIDGIFKYNALDKWSVLSSTLPTATKYGTTVFKDPYIYLVGGQALNTILEFDTNTETITNTYLMQETLREMSAEIVNDKVYIFGGQDLTISKNVELCDILKAPPSQHLSTTPSKHPSHIPSKDPSHIPSGTPSKHPSHIPSKDPSHIPSGTPSKHPSHIPSKDPSHIPSGTPSKHPSHIPSKDPSHIPSGEPSGTPVRHPTNNPFGTTTLTLFPSYLPTNNPNKAIFVYPPTIPVEESSSAPPTGLFDTRYGASQTMLYSNQDKPTDINHITTVSLVALIAVLCIASISAVFCLMRAKRQDGIKKTQKRMAVEIDVELAVNVAVKSGNIDEKDEREEQAEEDSIEKLYIKHHEVITKTSD
eukprot:985621_1